MKNVNILWIFKWINFKHIVIYNYKLYSQFINSSHQLQDFFINILYRSNVITVICEPLDLPRFSTAPCLKPNQYQTNTIKYQNSLPLKSFLNIIFTCMLTYAIIHLFSYYFRIMFLISSCVNPKNITGTPHLLNIIRFYEYPDSFSRCSKSRKKVILSLVLFYFSLFSPKILVLSSMT